MMCKGRGYMGRLLDVNLNSGTFQDHPLDEELCHQFVGGYGLGARILYERMSAHVDPLGPDNILGFLTGPVTGTKAIQGNRFIVVCKSPLTGGWGDANCGGKFGPALKAAGYDGILFSGVSPKPVYLFINDGHAEIRDAEWLWGMDALQTEEALKKHLGQEVEVAAIGQAGERLALIAAIITDKGRAAGRSGVGAVMGSKRLKAVAVRGHQEIVVAHPERLRAIREEYFQKVYRPQFDGLSDYGTLVINMEGGLISGDVPVKNWKGVASRDFPTGVDRFSSDHVMKYQNRKYACWRCPIACGGEMEVKESGPYQGTKHHKPEYETAAAFGPMCLNDDMPSLIKINELCNRYGLDTISAGCTIAFAIECFEQGLIALADTDGLSLRWSDHKTIVSLVHKIGLREGFGDILADGSRRAAERIGRGTSQYAMHIQGQEVPMHDPRYYNALGTVYVLNATPGRHTQGGACWFPTGYTKPEGFDDAKPETTGLAHKQMNALTHLYNVAGMCWFAMFSFDCHLLPDTLTAVTGWEWDLNKIFLTGERIETMRHLFNLREGLNPLRYEVPGRVMGHPPLESGPLAGKSVALKARLRAACEAYGWDPETAVPGAESLRRLGLEKLVGDLDASRNG